MTKTDKQIAFTAKRKEAKAHNLEIEAILEPIYNDPYLFRYTDRVTFEVEGYGVLKHQVITNMVTFMKFMDSLFKNYHSPIFTLNGVCVAATIAETFHHKKTDSEDVVLRCNYGCNNGSDILHVPVTVTIHKFFI